MDLPGPPDVMLHFVLKGDGWFSDLYSSSKGDTEKDKGEKADSADAPKKDDEKPKKKADEKSDKPGRKSGGKKGSSKAA